MREYKFRGIRIVSNEWVFGSLVNTIIPKRGRVAPEIEVYTEGKKISRYWVHPETVGQYIGMKDKNGKEIYEGDIVKETETGEVIDNIGVVKFYDGRFYLDNDSYEHWSDDSEFEIIGNIHEKNSDCGVENEKQCN